MYIEFMTNSGRVCGRNERFNLSFENSRIGCVILDDIGIRIIDRSDKHVSSQIETSVLLQFLEWALENIYGDLESMNDDILEIRLPTMTSSLYEEAKVQNAILVLVDKFPFTARLRLV